MNLLVLNELLNNPLEAFATFDHVNDKHSLVVLVLFQDVVLKLDIATTNSRQERFGIRVLLDVQSLTSNEIQVIMNLFNWKLDIELLNVEMNLLVNLVAPSWLESDWCLVE